MLRFKEYITGHSLTHEKGGIIKRNKTIGDTIGETRSRKSKNRFYKGQTMLYKTIHRQLSPLTPGGELIYSGRVNSSSLHAISVVLLLINTNIILHGNRVCKL